MPSLKDVTRQDRWCQKDIADHIGHEHGRFGETPWRSGEDGNFEPYANKFNDTMSTLSGGGNTDQFPLMEVRDVKTVEIVVLTSDRGLCGSFNSKIVKLAEKKMREYEAEGKTVSFVCVGKKETKH